MNRPSEYIRLADMGKHVNNEASVKAVDLDLETGFNDRYLHNDTVDTLFWDSLSVIIPDKATGKEKHVLQSIDGDVQAGMWCGMRMCF